MRCWICGSSAATGEHMTKASDLRALFGRVTQDSPLYIHTSLIKNTEVPGVNSDKLKFASLICSTCNNQRTQPYDRAWESLSQYLRQRQPPIRPGTFVNLAHVFPGSVRRSMLNVHLYFVKLFGCRIAQDDIPIDLGEFSESLLKGRPHQLVYLSFWSVNPPDLHKEAGHSQIQAAKRGQQITFAAWFYNVGPLAVNVIYAEPTERRRGLTYSWHPNTISKMLRIAQR